MKILVIFTGGTIGSTESNGYIGLQKKSVYRLLSLYQERMADSGTDDLDIEFVTVNPYTVLSENSTGKVLQRLADSVRMGIKRAEQEQYAGIIVTHGTDTLAYSAAMLGFLFGDSPIPVVLVSSNYILEDPRANGLRNFICAVEFIRQQSDGGVYVSYHNAGEVPRIHLGTRLLGHQAYSDAVYSLGDAFAWFDKDGELHMQKEGNGAAKRRCAGLRSCFTGFSSWDAPILQIYPSPGMCYPQIPTGTKAVLHHTYHAGTICSDTPEMKRFFAEAKKRRIPVFLTGVDMALTYESTKIYEQYSIIALPMASPVAMYIKLWLLLESGLNPEEWMAGDIAGEMLGTVTG
ncbi:MAG: asparaginase [Eubacteriales bacterium]|nr:asparaginase [Eubacteriales bacterium]